MKYIWRVILFIPSGVILGLLFAIVTLTGLSPDQTKKGFFPKFAIFVNNKCKIDL